MGEIEKLSEQSAKELLNEICEAFGIGEGVRFRGVILENINNSGRRSDCLSHIEQFHTAQFLNEDDEWVTEPILNWGEDPEEYIKTYKAMMEAYKR